MKEKTPEQLRAIEEACDYLCWLWLHKEQYYLLWLTKGDPTPPTKLSQAGLARAIHKGLCDRKGWSYHSDAQDVRAIKDTISRVVNHKVLTTKFLDRVGRDLPMDPEDIAAVKTLLSGGRLTHFPAGATADTAYNHETEQLHETHYIGHDKQPVKHRTLQRIRSIVGCLETYTFRYVPHDDIKMEVVQGGACGAPYQFDDVLHAIDIRLDQPLAYGQSASLEYLSWFQTPQNHPPYFNRAVGRKVDSVEIRVDFLGPVPRKIYWAEWDRYDEKARIIHKEPWRLIGNSVHRGLTHVEQRLMGFCWVW